MRNFVWSLFVTAISLSSNSVAAIAANFSYAPKEVEIYSTDFSNLTGWSLEGTTINTTTRSLGGTSAWGTAVYNLANALNLERGEVNLYWRGIFPLDARTEADKYYVGLEYYDNRPVNDPMFGTVDENAALKIELRPYTRTNIGTNSYNLYIDPDFDPINNYSPAKTQLLVDPNTNYRVNSPIDFRVNLQQTSSNTYTITPFVWYNNSWQVMEAKSGSASPLNVSGQDWVADEIDGQRPVENPVTFEGIFLQFRNPGSRVIALSLTQTQTQTLTTIPEPSNIFGLGILGLSGWCFKKMGRRIS